MTQDAPNRRRDVARIQRRGRDLVEQWLEEMMIAAIDQRESNRLIAKHTSGGNPAESAADDHNVRRVRRAPSLLVGEVTMLFRADTIQIVSPPPR